MYAFDELCDDLDTPFCYLLGVLKRMPRESKLKPEFFSGEFEWIMNVEDQAESVKRRASDLSGKLAGNRFP